MIKKDGVLYFEKFLEFPELIHGFSTKEFGNMRPMGIPDPLKSFASSLNIDSQKIVRMHQAHSANVAWVTDSQGMNLDTTDGVLTAEKGLFLSVITADCVPILLYNQKKQIVGTVHAGWRGAYKGIVGKTIAILKEKGSDPADIMVGIGPCIRSCCYDIAEEHAAMFRSQFPEWEDILISREKKIFLNLPKLVQYQLQSVGIPATNMEDAGICTFDSPEDLFSYRREGKSFGEFVGIIGIKA